MPRVTCMRQYGPYWIVVSILIALAISGMLVGSLIYLLVIQPRLSDAQDVQRDMVQNARIVLEVLSRELRMAGYNPTGARFDGLVVTPTSLHIRADVNGDGETNGPDEDIHYTYDAASQQIVRRTPRGQEPLAEHIQALTLVALDQEGKPTTVRASIRQLRLTVTARAAGAETASAVSRGPRTYTLSTLVNLRNLAVVSDYDRS